jgi:hypothetical protein
MRGRTQRLWMHTVKVGDVLEDAWGNHRVVRSVSRHRNGDLRAISVTIRRKSWTNRAYTTLCRSDLMAWRSVGVTVQITSQLDATLSDDIAQIKYPPRLCAADVRGIA